MKRETDDLNMSELEREFEDDMKDAYLSNQEFDDDREFEGSDDFELGDSDFEDYRVESDVDDYAERFMELGRRGFESESELDDSVNEILNEMERDYFFKGLGKKFKKYGKGLLKKGLAVALKSAGNLPMFQGIKGLTQLARGDLKGMLGSLAKSALGTFMPGGPVALQGLNALGFEISEDPAGNQEAWRNFVTVAREAYDYLGSNLNETANNPLVANRLAHNAIEAGLRKVSMTSKSGGHGKRKRRISLQRGDILVIRGE
jgi:hypothetical protein